jgi:hypothetical protein
MREKDSYEEEKGKGREGVKDEDIKNDSTGFSYLLTYLLLGSTAHVGPWPPDFFTGSITSNVLRSMVVSPTSNPQPGGPGDL